MSIFTVSCVRLTKTTSWTVTSVMVTFMPREKFVPVIVAARFTAPWPPPAGVIEVNVGTRPVTVKHDEHAKVLPVGVVMTPLYVPVAASVRSKMAERALAFGNVTELPTMSGCTVGSPAFISLTVLPLGMAVPPVKVICFVPVFAPVVGAAVRLSTPKQPEHRTAPLSLVFVSTMSRRPAGALAAIVRVKDSLSAAPFTPLVTVMVPGVSVVSVCRAAPPVGGMLNCTVGFGELCTGVAGASKFRPVIVMVLLVATAPLAGATEEIDGPTSTVKAGVFWFGPE